MREKQALAQLEKEAKERNSEFEREAAEREKEADERKKKAHQMQQETEASECLSNVTEVNLEFDKEQKELIGQEKVSQERMKVDGQVKA
ncbi:unnamed protein product [Caretta caretta]